MNKPQVNINLNIDVLSLDENTTATTRTAQIRGALAVAQMIQEEMDDGKRLFEPDKPPKHRNEVPPSRHHQSVAANTRIMDAIEFINKEMRLLKGHSENGTLKVFEELKSILLGI